MSKATVWEVSKDIETAFWKLANSLWAKQRAAVPDGVPCIPSFERTKAEYRATLKFHYVESSETAYFSYVNGAWNAKNYPND